MVIGGALFTSAMNPCGGFRFSARRGWGGVRTGPEVVIPPPPQEKKGRGPPTPPPVSRSHTPTQGYLGGTPPPFSVR